MSDAPPTMTPADASRRHDLTLALTPGQLLLLVLGALLVLRVLRGMRGRTVASRLSRR